MHNRAISFKVILTIFQVFSQVFSVFFLYTFGYKTLGEELFGSFALLLVINIVVQTVSLPISSGAVKFISEYILKNDISSATKVHQTIALVIFTIGGLVYLVWLLIITLLSYGDSLILLSNLSLIMIAAAVCFVLVENNCGALDATGRVNQRILIKIFDSWMYFLIGIVLGSQFGIVGFCFAYFLKLTVTFFISFGVLYAPNSNKRLDLSTFFRFPQLHSSSLILSKLFDYGKQVQAIGIITLFLEPMIKFFFASISLSAVGYYELINRIVLGIRQILIGLYQAFFPKIISLTNTNKDITKPFILVFSGNLILSFAIHGTIVCLGYIPISLIFSADLTQITIKLLRVFAIGWMYNSLAIPSWFFLLAGNKLKINIIANACLLIFIFIFGGIMYLFNVLSLMNLTLVIAWALSLGAFVNIYLHFQMLGCSLLFVDSKLQSFSIFYWFSFVSFMCVVLVWGNSWYWIVFLGLLAINLIVYFKFLLKFSFFNSMRLILKL